MEREGVSFLVDPASLSLRERSLLRRLKEGYTAAIARDVLLPLVHHTSPISLRALDWAVVNWSKQHNIVCSSLVPGEMTNVHDAYRTALSFWKRRLFDCFRRRARIRVRVGDQEHETTLGQANFALWAYQTGVLSYVLGHYELILTHMNAVSQRQKRIKRDALKSGRKRKRTELTPASSTVCVAYRSPIRVQL